MNFRRIYVIYGNPESEFYEKNATDLDYCMNGDYELINSDFRLFNTFWKKDKVACC